MYAVKMSMYYIYKRTTPTAVGVPGLRLSAFYATATGVLCLRLRTGELQVYYGRAAGCKPTSGH